MSKLSKQNIDALVKVNFSARIDFSAEGGIKIEEIERIENIVEEQNNIEEHTFSELNNIFNNVRLNKKQKELLISHFLSLKETYFLKGEKVFNHEYASIKGIGRSTKKILIASFEDRLK